jgi:hypothetical protein
VLFCGVRIGAGGIPLLQRCVAIFAFLPELAEIS